MTTTKTTLKRIICVFSCCLVVVFSFAFPSSAVDTDYTFEVNFPNPIDTGYDGYFTIPYQDSGRTHLKVVYWKFFNTNSIADSSEAGQDPIVTIKFTSKTSFYVNFSYLGENPVAVYVNTLDSAVDTIGSPQWEVISYDSSYSHLVSMAVDNFCRPQLYSGVLEITTNSNYLNLLPIKSYDIIWSNNDTFEQLTSILNHFDSLLDKIDFTNEQLSQVISKFDELLELQNQISADLSDFVYYYWEQFTSWQFPESINTIVARLDAIIRLLNKKGEVEQTTVDSSNVDDYLDIEQSLVNNDEADSAIGDMNVSIDGHSYSFIWSLVTDIFNSHPEVFGLVITILTLGFIALLLNR